MTVFKVLEASAWGDEHFRCRALKKKDAGVSMDKRREEERTCWETCPVMITVLSSIHSGFRKGWFPTRYATWEAFESSHYCIALSGVS